MPKNNFIIDTYKTEKAILGSILFDCSINQNNALEAITSSGVKSSMFMNPHTRQVFEIITSMIRKKEKIDLLTVSNRFEQERKFGDNEAFIIVENFVDDTPSPNNIKDYIETLKTSHAWRQFYDLSFDIREWISNNKTPSEISSNLISREHTISNMLNKDALKSSHVSYSADKLINQINLNATVLPKVASSINTIRNRIVGYPVGRMTVIASRPGIGKTSMSCTEVLSMALKGYAVSVLTFEMDEEEYTARLACIYAEISLEAYIDGDLSDHGKEKLKGALHIISQLKIRYASSDMNIEQVLYWIGKEAEHSSVIVIDHFLLIKMMSKKGQRESSIYGGWSRRLRAAAKEHNVALLVLTQLRRANIWKGKQMPPTKNDLKETGCLEEDSYLLILLHDHPVKKDDTKISNYQAIIDKHRNGWHGVCPVQFEAYCASFTGIGKKGNFDGLL